MRLWRSRLRVRRLKKSREVIEEIPQEANDAASAAGSSTLQHAAENRARHLPRAERPDFPHWINETDTRTPVERRQQGPLALPW